MSEIQVNDHEFNVERREAWPAHLLIKVESFSLIWENKVKEYESREFMAGNHKWKLIIYPDGHGKDDYISVYLVMAGTSSLSVNFEVNAVFNVLLYDHMKSNFICFGGKVRCYNSFRYKWGFSNLISKKFLMDPSNGFLYDDNCVFGAEVFVIESQRIFDRLSLKVENSVKHTWEITNFSELKSKFICSEEFTVGGFKWKTKLFPNGNEDQVGKSISIYLDWVDSDSHKKVLASCDFCIKSNHKCFCPHWFTTSESDWGFRDFIPIGDMHDPDKDIVVDGVFSVVTKVSVLAVRCDAVKP